MDWGADAGVAIDELLAEPFGNWHVQTRAQTLQLRVTKKGQAQLHRAAATADDDADAATVESEPQTHDRAKRHLLDTGDPLFDVIGGNAAKRRQVNNWFGPTPCRRATKLIVASA